MVFIMKNLGHFLIHLNIILVSYQYRRRAREIFSKDNDWYTLTFFRDHERKEISCLFQLRK